MTRSFSWRYVFVIAGSLIAFGGCAPKQQDIVLATVAGKSITIAEYEQQFLRNNISRDSAAATPLAERERFLDLMINYRLKLTEAARESLEHRASIRHEIEQYQGSLTASFVADRELVTPAIRRIYERRKDELRASHILLALPPQATAADSAATYKKAADIIALLKGGAPFDSLARVYSTDPGAQRNGGDLYYFTTGMMIPQFEDGVYALHVGEVSTVRTQFGLHIVKLTERQPSRGEIRASHIMIRFQSTSPTPEDTAACYAKAVAIRDSLRAGVAFADLAKRNSGDEGSAPRGGDLGWFARRRWVQPFDEAVFRMKVGQTSDIVRSPFGYHLIFVQDQRPPKSFEESTAELQEAYQKGRFTSEIAALTDSVRHRLGATRNAALLEQFYAACDTSKSTRDSGWAAGVAPAMGRQIVFRAGQKVMTLDSLVAQISARPDLAPVLATKATLPSPVAKVEEQFVWTAAADSYAVLYPDLARIQKEYREGILLYQMEQDNVWSKVTPSDSVLRLYHGTVHDRFVFPERVDFSVLKAPSPKTIAQVAAKLEAGRTMEDIAREDSLRMAAPDRFTVSFGPSSSSLTADARKTLALIASLVKADTATTVLLFASTDTLAGKKSTVRDRRFGAITAQLTRTLGIASRRVIDGATAKGSAFRPGPTLAANDVQLAIVGRLPILVGGTETLILPASTDERSAHADSLKPGQYSASFASHGLYAIVRLNKRVPPREKTFEEAQPEVSALYQETESKRLTESWLGGLRAKYPVVVNKEALRAAFSTVEK